jgi:hypothetical protein
MEFEISYFYFPAFVAVITTIIVLLHRHAQRRTPRMKHGEILPASEMQRRYNLHGENRPQISIDPQLVPVGLRHLVPLAEKWGVGDDLIRGDIIVKASGEETQTLQDALTPEVRAAIEAWLDSCQDAGKMPEAMVHFMYMLGVPDEILPGEPSSKCWRRAVAEQRSGPESGREG